MDKNIIFFIKVTKVLEVANFRFLANFRYLTLKFGDYLDHCIQEFINGFITALVSKLLELLVLGGGLHSASVLLDILY